MTNDLPTQQPRQRVRITYEKGESIKFVSNNDEARLWERAAARRSAAIVQERIQSTATHTICGTSGRRHCRHQRTAGHHPEPAGTIDEVRARIAAKLPPGVIIHDIAERSLKEEALQSCMLGADYTILIYAEPDEIPVARLVESIQRFLGRDVIVRERQRKGLKYTYNLRPLVLELRYEGYDATSEEHRIALRVQQRPGATGRPDEVVDALGLRRLRPHAAAPAALLQQLRGRRGPSCGISGCDARQHHAFPRAAKAAAQVAQARTNN